MCQLKVSEYTAIQHELKYTVRMYTCSGGTHLGAMKADVV